MLTVTIDQSERISGADMQEQAVKKMRTGSAALSLPNPRAFFAFLITERLSTTISEPETGYVRVCNHSCDVNRLEFSQPLSCLYQAMQTRKTFSIG